MTLGDFHNFSEFYGKRELYGDHSLGPREALDKGCLQPLLVAQVQPVSREASLDWAELGRGGVPTLCQAQKGHLQWGGKEKVGEPCPLLAAGSNWFFGASTQ